MSERLVIDFTPAEGAVGRIVGVVERRGFRLRGLNMSEQGERASLTLDLDPRDPSRRVEMLRLQLGRLYDVSAVSVSTPEAGQVQ